MEDNVCIGYSRESVGPGAPKSEIKGVPRFFKQALHRRCSRRASDGLFVWAKFHMKIRVNAFTGKIRMVPFLQVKN